MLNANIVELDVLLAPFCLLDPATPLGAPLLAGLEVE